MNDIWSVNSCTQVLNRVITVRDYLIIIRVKCLFFSILFYTSVKGFKCLFTNRLVPEDRFFTCKHVINFVCLCTCRCHSFIFFFSFGLEGSSVIGPRLSGLLSITDDICTQTLSQALGFTRRQVPGPPNSGLSHTDKEE